MTTEKDRLLKAANRLEEVSTEISRFARNYSRTINTIATALRDEIEKRFSSGTSDVSDMLIVERERTDPPLRGFVKMTAFACQSFFGAQLYSTVATIANVALDRSDMKASRVRALVRG